ncbi:exocyst subunit [Saitoella coloradoensis]
MEERKRSLADDGSTSGPSLKRERLDHELPPDAAEEIETFQKEAIWRQMKEYQRLNERAEAEVARLKERSTYHEDHLRVVDAWWAQLLDEMRIVAGEAVSNPPEDILASVLFSDSETFAAHLEKQKSRIVKTANALLKYSGDDPQSKLKADCSRLSSEVRALRVDLESAQSEKLVAEEQLDDVKEKLRALEKKWDRSRSKTIAKLEGRDSDANVKEEEGGKATAKRDDTPADSKENSEAAQKLEEANAVLKKIREQMSELQKAHEAVVTENTKLKVELANPISDEVVTSLPAYVSLKNNFDSISARIEGLDSLNEILRQENTTLNAERDTFRTELGEEQTAALTENTAQIARLEQDLTRVRFQRDELQANLSVLKETTKKESASIREIGTLADTRLARIHALEAEVARLRTDGTGIVGEVEGKTEQELKEMVTMLTKQNESLKAELPALEAAFEKAMKQSQSKVEEIVEKEEVFKRLQAEKSKADQKYFAAMKSKDTLSAEMKALKHQAAKSTEVIESLKEAEASVSAKLGNLQKQLAKMQESHEGYEKRYREYVRLEGESKLRVAELDERIKKLAAELSAKDAQLSSESTSKRAAEETVAELRVQVKRSKASAVTVANGEDPLTVYRGNEMSRLNGDGIDSSDSLEQSFETARPYGSSDPPSDRYDYDDYYDSRRRSMARDRMNGNGQDAGLDGVLRDIDRTWPLMSSENCNPVSVALQLLDSQSSLGRGRNLNSFQDTTQKLDKSLQEIVNEHYLGFNDAVGKYGQIMQAISASQKNVRQMKEGLLQAREELSAQRSDLLPSSERSQQYKEMLRLIGQIQTLHSIPDRLDALIASKNFLAAVSLLKSGLKQISRREMEGVGALVDIRAYLKQQEAGLFEVLVEELHNHVYLKSPYTEGMWEAWKTGQKDLPAVSRPSSASNGQITSAFQSTRQNRKLGSQNTSNSGVVLFNDGEISQPPSETQTGNPETDSLQYIRLLVESLAALERLPKAFEVLSQRLPVELYQLVDKTIEEVDRRHLGRGLRVGRNQEPKNGVKRLQSKTVLPMSIANVISPTNRDVLEDLLWTLYSKFSATLTGHRTIHDVVHVIATRPENTQREDLAGIAEDLSFGFLEVWKSYQSEVKGLLHDYITDDTLPVKKVGAAQGVKEQQVKSLDSLFTGSARERGARIWKLGNAEKVADDEQDLIGILHKSVPGLVAENGVTASTTSTSTVTNGMTNAGHTVLIAPSVFNIRTLMDPTTALLRRISALIPPNSKFRPSTFTGFFDDFLVNGFMPQLEDTVGEMFASAIGGEDSFHIDEAWMTISTYPIGKSAVALSELIDSLCRMLGSMSHYRDEYSLLVIYMLGKYYKKCYDRFRELVGMEGATQDMKTSARWSNLEEMRALVGPILEKREEGEDVSVEEWEEFVRMEIGVQLKLKGSQSLGAGAIIQDVSLITRMVTLYNSVKWLSARVRPMAHIEDRNGMSMRMNGASTERTTEDRPRLPLTKELTSRFDALLATYDQLAESVLLTLRIEMRLHVTYHIELALTDGNYSLDEKTVEPDPHVSDLNADLVLLDERLSGALPNWEYRFVTKGMAVLIDELLVTLAGESIRLINKVGVLKMMLNILALQQNLKNFVSGPSDAQLARSTEYWKLYELGPARLLEIIKTHQPPHFTFDQLKNMLRLQYSDNLARATNENRRDSALQARRGFNERCIALGEYFHQIENQEKEMEEGEEAQAPVPVA